MDAVEMVYSIFLQIALLTSFWKTRAVSKAMKAHDFEQALELRGPEFKEMLEGFRATSTLAVKEAWLPKDKASIS